MRPFDHILVATDFSPAAEAALDAAIAIAQKFDARITLVHAYTVPIAADGFAYAAIWQVEEGARASLESALQAARGKYSRIESQLVGGDAWRVILDQARLIGADLIVMGTHGRRGLARAFLGSVAERVVRLATVPVFTISSAAQSEARARELVQAQHAAE